MLNCIVEHFGKEERLWPYWKRGWFPANHMEEWITECMKADPNKNIQCRLGMYYLSVFPKDEDVHRREWRFVHQQQRRRLVAIPPQLKVLGKPTKREPDPDPVVLGGKFNKHGVPAKKRVKYVHTTQSESDEDDVPIVPPLDLESQDLLASPRPNSPAPSLDYLCCSSSESETSDDTENTTTKEITQEEGAEITQEEGEDKDTTTEEITQEDEGEEEEPDSGDLDACSIPVIPFKRPGKPVQVCTPNSQLDIRYYDPIQDAPSMHGCRTDAMFAYSLSPLPGAVPIKRGKKFRKTGGLRTVTNVQPQSKVTVISPREEEEQEPPSTLQHDVIPLQFPLDRALSPLHFTSDEEECGAPTPAEGRQGEVTTNQHAQPPFSLANLISPRAEEEQEPPSTFIPSQFPLDRALSPLNDDDCEM